MYHVCDQKTTEYETSFTGVRDYTLERMVIALLNLFVVNEVHKLWEVPLDGSTVRVWQNNHENQPAQDEYGFEGPPDTTVGVDG